MFAQLLAQIGAQRPNQQVQPGMPNFFNFVPPEWWQGGGPARRVPPAGMGNVPSDTTVMPRGPQYSQGQVI